LQKQNHSFRVTRKLLQARKNIMLHRGMYWGGQQDMLIK